MVLKKAKKSGDAVLLFILRKYILSSIKKSDFLFYSVTRPTELNFTLFIAY